MHQLGYCRVKRNGQYMPVHRFYYVRHYGPVPEGKELHHLCRVRSCCNPEHLKPVTHVENIRESPRIQLSMEKARQIRQLHAERGLRIADLARMFGVRDQTIYKVLTNQNWRE